MSIPSSNQADMSQMQSNNVPAQATSSRPAHTPPFTGFVETTYDALLVFEAGRRGLIPRVTRRLTEDERSMVKSGAVFIFDESESGIKRWTDGLVWSPSRILGNFLVYRETDKRNAASQGAPASAMAPPMTADASVPRPDQSPFGSGALQRPRSQSEGGGIDRNRERQLVGSLTSSYRFRDGGLIKKTISVFVNGYAQHLVSYYTLNDVLDHKLRTPSSVPELASLEISADFLSKQNFRFPPQVEIGMDGIPRYRGEPDIPPSPSHGMVPYPIVPLVENMGHPVYDAPPPQYVSYQRQSTGGPMRPTSSSRRANPYDTHSPRGPHLHMPPVDRRSSQSSLHSVHAMPVEQSYAPLPTPIEVPSHHRYSPGGHMPVVQSVAYSPLDASRFGSAHIPRDMGSVSAQYTPRDQTQFQPSSLPANSTNGHLYLDPSATSSHGYSLSQSQSVTTPTQYNAPSTSVGTPHPSLAGWNPSPQAAATSSSTGSASNNDWRAVKANQDIL